MTVDAPDARLDAVEFGIISGRLQSIADEAGTVLVKTAFSQIVREAKDLACVVQTPAGTSVVVRVGDIGGRGWGRAGTGLVVESAGGGGYGEPSACSEEAIRRDIEHGFVN